MLGVLLVGSPSVGYTDSHSDIDLEVFVTKESFTNMRRTYEAYESCKGTNATLNKERALRSLDFCGNKYLKDMIELFCENSLKNIVVCDWKDKKVLTLVSNVLKLNPPLDFKNDNSDKGVQWKSKACAKGITFIALGRTRRGIAWR